MSTTQSCVIQLPDTVAIGGTGLASTTAYSPIAGGTSSTAALQMASTGQSSSGYILTSTGASSLPTFQAAASTANFVFLTKEVSYGPIDWAIRIPNNGHTLQSYGYSSYYLSWNAYMANGTEGLFIEADNVNTNYQSGCLYIPYNSSTWTNYNLTTALPITPNTTPNFYITQSCGFCFLGNATNGSPIQFSGQSSYISNGTTNFSNFFGTNTYTNPGTFNVLNVGGGTGYFSVGTVISLYGVAS